MSLKLSIVTSLYYSESYVEAFYNRLREVLDSLTTNYEIIFVNDGSPDKAAEKVLRLQEIDANITLVDLSRNFGHHQALLTGLQHADGDLIFLIDSDLEEDPSLLTVFWNEMQMNSSADVVYGIQATRKGGWFERTSGTLFYRFLDFLTSIHYPANTLTARLMKRKYVEGVLKFTEKTLDVWAIFVLTGFNQIGIPVTKGSKGISTYSLSKKLKMTLEIITSLSHRPLYLIFLLGLIWLCISAGVFFMILVQKWLYGAEIEGWASIMASVWLIGGVIIFLIGVIGIYLSKIFLEIKNRPWAIIKAVYKKQQNEL